MSVAGACHATGQGALIACHVPTCRTCFLDGRDGAVLPGGLAVCDACAEREEVCRNGHALAKTDDELWGRFVLLGIQADEVESLELRNCPVCRSSIARFVAVKQ